MRFFNENASQKIELFRFIFLFLRKNSENFGTLELNLEKKFEVKGTED